MKLNLKNLNIFPDPIACAERPGGVNSVVFDHAVGFLNAGYSINDAKSNEKFTVVHALAQAEKIDVFHCHGLYPIGKGYFDHSYNHANEIVLRNALRAKLTICISEFSANILRHKLHIDPHVTRNGIWIKDYKKAGSPSGPILFPKAALDANASDSDMKWLKANTDFDLISIAEIPGIRSTGPLNRIDFLDVVRKCSIYLGTTKENNSMATMEAMCSGVPVVGYDIGFNSEWLLSGSGCELVQRGDQAGLREAIRKVQSNWKQYSKQARDFAERFDWQPVINELIGLYEKVAKPEPIKEEVSIIIPVHNYDQYLEEAITSALSQTRKCEVIVVDDKSTDYSVKIAKSYGDRITLIENEINQGVAETRNIGIRAASGKYIVCLDADDRLKPTFVDKHLAALKNAPGETAVAYAPIQFIDEDGMIRKETLFRANADPLQQVRGKNQIPSCCMFPKVWWTRAGGYDGQFTPAEDANLWLKFFGLGGLPVKASNDPLMDYRIHQNSLSSRGFPDWFSGHEARYTVPIAERDSKITIILDEVEGAYRTLWSLENQEYKNWNCILPQKNCQELKETFPWLNRSMSRQGTVLHIKSGEVLPRNYLSEFARQIPRWMMPGQRSLSA